MMTIDKTLDAIDALTAYEDEKRASLLYYDESDTDLTIPDLKQLAAELKELRRIIAFYGIEIMPDGSFTSPQITQNEVEVKELREFVGAMNSIGIEEWVGRWKQGAFWFYDSAGIPVEYGTDPADAYRKMKAGEGE